MIHIATVHWQDETWINIQLAYFEKFLPSGSYRVYAFLNGIDALPYQDKIYHISTEPIQPHVTKLNLLAEKICGEAEPEDIIYFIDGDAFPIGDVHSFVCHGLERLKLVAIQRLENDGDPQPHPSFCATTVSFWQEIEGDWGQGPQWKTVDGRLRTDTGGLLWQKLNDMGIEWEPIHRSNVMELHPLWFGVYGDLIYHHGAAFRTPYCIVDIRQARKIWWKRCMMILADSPLGNVKGGWGQNAIYSFVMKNEIRLMLTRSRDLIAAMQKDLDFAQQFINPANLSDKDGCKGLRGNENV